MVNSAIHATYPAKWDHLICPSTNRQRVVIMSIVSARFRKYSQKRKTAVCRNGGAQGGALWPVAGDVSVPCRSWHDPCAMPAVC